MKQFKITIRGYGPEIISQTEAKTMRAAKAAASRLFDATIPAACAGNRYHALAKRADIEDTATGKITHYLRAK